MDGYYASNLIYDSTVSGGILCFMTKEQKLREKILRLEALLGPHNDLDIRMAEAQIEESKKYVIDNTTKKIKRHAFHRKKK